MQWSVYVILGLEIWDIFDLEKKLHAAYLLGRLLNGFCLFIVKEYSWW